MNEENKPCSALNTRRSSIRLPLRTSVRIECRKGALGFGPNLAAAAVDLSETGVRLVLKSDLPRGQQVEIILQGQCQPVKRVGMVAWSKNRPDGAFEVGIHFDSNLSYSDYRDFTQSQRSRG
jgi:hypothetical protein